MNTVEEQKAAADAINPYFMEALSPRLSCVPPLTTGMMGQSGEAKNAEINATIGTSMRHGKFWVLDGMENYFPADSLSYGSIYAEKAVAAWNQFVQSFCEKPEGCRQHGPQNGIATHGIAEGLDLLACAFMSSGDPIILPDQTWPNINNLFIRWHGGKPYQFSFFNEAGGYNVAGLAEMLHKAKADGATKAMIYLNSPANPNGYVLRRDDLAQLRKLLTQAGKDMTLIIVSDEAYMSLSYVEDGHRGPVAEHLYGLCDRCFVFSLTGGSKLLQLFGLRTGFISLWHQSETLWPIVQDKLLWLARTKRSFANNVGLTLLMKTLADPNGWTKVLEERHTVLQARYEAAFKAAQARAEEGGWAVYPGGGGYFIVLDVGEGQASDFRKKALALGVGTITQGTRNIRVAISCIEAQEMDEIFARLVKIKG